MTAMTRRALVGALAAAQWLPRPARAAEFTLKLGNNMTMTHPMNVHAAHAAERIAKATDGRVELQLFPSSQLGSDTDMLGQVRSGALEFFCCSGLILSTLVPVASIPRPNPLDSCHHAARPASHVDDSTVPGDVVASRPAEPSKRIAQALHRATASRPSGAAGELRAYPAPTRATTASPVIVPFGADDGVVARSPAPRLA